MSHTSQDFYTIAHISDTHIRNFMRKEEYLLVFDKIFASLREKNPDLIVHTGDIAHTKTQISPDYIELCTFFMSGLEKIAPVYVLLGNHDGNLKNPDRSDSVSSVVKAMKTDNEDLRIHILKDSGEYPVQIGDKPKIIFNALSCFDKVNWNLKPTDQDNINIALFHGALSGCVTDSGHVLTNGELDIADFVKFDYTMLGDIHKANQKLDLHGRIRYAGSTIQQNFSEADDKGYLVWKIWSKDAFEVEHILIKNPNPFINVEVDANENYTPRNIPLKARIRLKSYAKWDSVTSKMKIEEFKNRYEPLSITYSHVGTSSDGFVSFDGETLPDITRIESQNSLIERYFEGSAISRDLIDKILEENGKIRVEDAPETFIRYGTTWSIKKLEWSNMFVFGKKNSVDFSELQGIIGIFGENYTGKSSILEILTYGIFGNSAKSVKRLYDMINHDKSDGSITVYLEINGKDYKIHREFIKENKRSNKARENLDFFNITDDISLNGETKNDTIKNIRSYVGNIEEFLITSYSAQATSDIFLGEKSTGRKKILANFLQLSFLGRKYKVVKEQEKFYKNLLKTKYMSDKTTIIKELHVRKRELQTSLTDIAEQIEALRKVHLELEKKYSSLEDLKQERSQLEKRLKELTSTVKAKRATLEKHEGALRSAKEAGHKKLKELKSISYSEEEYAELRAELNELKEKRLRLNNLKHNAKRLEDDIKRKINQSSILKEVPCGGVGEYGSCQFLKNAREASEKINGLKDQRTMVLENIAGYSDLEAEISKTHKLVQALETMRDRKNSLANELSKLKSKVEVEKNNLKHAKESLDMNEGWLKEAEQKLARNMNTDLDGLAELENAKKDLKQKEIEKERKIIEITNIENKIQNVREYNKEREEYLEKKKIYTSLSKCYHSNGIPLAIIKSALPILNEEMSKVAGNLVDFHYSIELDGKNVEFYLARGSKKTPIELCSGAERSIASICFRVAIRKLTSYPESDIIILDEPGSEFDEKHRNYFLETLLWLKTYYHKIILISHLEYLKDICDKDYRTEKKKYSRIVT